MNPDAVVKLAHLVLGVLVLFAGRLCDQKQPRVLAGTLRELARRGARFRAVIAGDGEQRRSFEALLDSYALHDRVISLGRRLSETLAPSQICEAVREVTRLKSLMRHERKFRPLVSRNICIRTPSSTP